MLLCFLSVSLSSGFALEDSKSLPFWQVDAFSAEIFKGNPAAVFIFDEEPEDEFMLNIAQKMNLSETAFVILGEKPKIRWFTPSQEVNLCGHATLAAAHILSWEQGTFQSRSGPLTVTKEQDGYLLDFPRQDTIEKPEYLKVILDILGEEPLFIGSNGEDCMVVVDDVDKIYTFIPDFAKITRIPDRGLLLTAKGEDHDYVYRGFFPKLDIPEDPVTGSANTCLAPYWAKELGKNKLSAFQASARTGSLLVEVLDDHVQIFGRAVTTLQGEMYHSSMNE